ncbi:MAG: propionyl-CoA synthetase [Saprospiraceae bacterium]|jgi:propionyl-CoA synthetase
MSKFDQTYLAAKQNPEAFWAEAAEQVVWTKKWDKVLDDSTPPYYRWFQGGKINACYNAVDRHVEAGRGEQTAIIYDSPITGSKRKISYQQLLERVSKFAGVLRDNGVESGDRVIVYMPMVAEAVVSMLACARIGAIHSVVFGGFAASELAVRIDDAGAKVIVTASCGIEPSRTIEYMPLVRSAIELSKTKPSKVIVLQRQQALAELNKDTDIDWLSAEGQATPAACVPMESTDPLYILYTSGTTGQPKGVVKDIGGTVVSLHWTMKNIYNVEPGDVYWAASDVGWVVGHSYIVYAPLFGGNTTIVFEGKPVGTPDPGTFWRIVEEYKVKVLFTAPTAFRAIKKEDPNGEYIAKYDVSSLESLFLAGERLDPSTQQWASAKLGVPVIDHWWQTETGWAICSNCLGIEQLPIVEGSPTRPVPGYEMAVLNDEGNPISSGEIGSLVIKLPLPPGTFPTLWNAKQRYFDSYLGRFPGYYESGDSGYIDENGYVFVMARTDDVINVAGHRLSTGGMEEVLAAHPDVAECAVIGVDDVLKGQLPLGLMVLSNACDRGHDEIVKEAIQMVRERIGPVAAFKMAAVVTGLPKTRSGKVLRGTMKKIADNTDWTMPATVDDPSVFDGITAALQSLNYAKTQD